MINAACALLACYVAGSIPFGLLVARVFGRIDLREHGSGNIGATNVARTMGFRWGGLVLLLDALKGGLSTLWLPPALYGTDTAGFTHLRVACGLAAVLGHMFPCWLRFRGGKGVATALGVVAVLAPTGTVAAAAVFALVFAATRIVSIASLTGSAFFAATELWLLRPNPFAVEHWSMAAFSLAVPLLIVFRHRANIRRLWRGEEPRMSRSVSKGPRAGAAEDDAEEES
jgi:acyl phosphate:glycerol-3-phosphate acyltransferase